MHSLPLFLRLTGKHVVLLGDGDAAAAKRRLLERAGAHVETAYHPEARVAVVAMEDAGEAEAAAAELRERGLLVNVVDQPQLCDFTFPSILDRDPVLIAVGTGGASAGLAKALRLRLESLLPANLGDLARNLFDAREKIFARWPDAASRRRAIDVALAPDGVLDPLRADSPDRVTLWTLSAEKLTGVIRHHRIELTSDDPDDLTIGQARLLGMADAVFHAPDMPAAILARVRADAVVMPFPLPEPKPDISTKLTIWLDWAKKP